MKVLIDITHPAYAHFFRTVVPRLREFGHEVFITSRDKDVTLDLLDSFGFEHRVLSRARESKLHRLVELAVRLMRLALIVRRFKPDVLLARDGLFACIVGFFTKRPSISFDDTNDAPIQQSLYFPFATRIYTDKAYGRNIGQKHRTYSGVSCLAYLVAPRFVPDPEILEKNGLHQNDRFVVIRLVSWNSNHDMRQRGISHRLLERMIEAVEKLKGKVLISSEIKLPASMEKYRLSIPPQDIHHIIAYAKLTIGESPTMAAESAILGVPSIYISTRRTWYTNLLEKETKLVHQMNKTEDCLSAIETKMLGTDVQHDDLNRYIEGSDDLVEVVCHSLAEFDHADG